MGLLLKTNLKVAFSNLGLNKTRSFLTCLGIAIGVAAVVLILSLAGGINRLISDQIKASNANLIVVRPSSETDLVGGFVTELTSSNKFLKSTLRLDDVDAIREIEKAERIAPIAVSESLVRYNRGDESYTVSARILATNSDLAAIAGLQLRAGTFLNTELTMKTAVIGYTLANQLFGTSEIVGTMLTINGERVMIVGTLTERDDPINFNNIDYNNSLIMDINQYAEIDNERPQIQQINIEVLATEDVAGVSGEVQKVLKEKRDGVQNFIVESGDDISHPAGSLFSIVSMMLTIVAAVSLVVGGIGIMNIILVSVSERTREIGIRKAVGANFTNILLQFLFESLLLSIIGGILGFMGGYLLAFLLSLVTPFDPYISQEIVIQISVVTVAIGTLFGLYPAIKAARKNPIDALRYYR